MFQTEATNNPKNLALVGTGDSGSGDQQQISSIMLNVPLLQQAERIADLMAGAKVEVPDHLKGSAPDCYAVVLQAIQWKMNPFVVAQKTHLVSGKLGYEAQLVNALIVSMAPTKDRLNYEWYGPWERVIGNFVEKTSQKGNKYTTPNWSLGDEKGLGIRVWATMKGEEQPRVLDLLLSQAQPRNSTLWATDPKQQLAYLASKRWARLHCPDVILGVYTPDEFEQTENSSYQPRDAGPAEVVLDAYPDELLQEHLPKWASAIEANKASAEQIIAMVGSKYQLSDEQKEAIRNLGE